MTVPPPIVAAMPRPNLPLGVPALALLAVALGLFGVLAAFPFLLGVPIAVAGAGGAFLLRNRGGPRSRAYAFVPPLVGLVLLASNAPSAPSTDLVGGLAAVALLAWLADDPARAAGGISRALPSLLLVLVTLGIAWVGAFLLPAGTALIGVGAGLLVVVMILVAVLLGRPDLIDREPPATA